MTLPRRIAEPLAVVVLVVAALAALAHRHREDLRWTARLVTFALARLHPEPLNAVHGTVVRYDTGQPIEGARVLARYHRKHDANQYLSEASTDSRGEFTVQTTRDPGLGFVPLEVTAPGYLKKIATRGDTITLIPAPR
jgi:hypothetical protein